MYHKFILCMLLLSSLVAKAQIEGKKPVPPPPVKEADVMFSKRIWRVIELREKQNKVICFPANHIGKVLYNGVLSRELKPYKDDSLRAIFDLETFSQRGGNKVLVRRLLDPNDNDGAYVTDTVYDGFIPEQRIKQLLLLEELYFDKTQGREIIRTIAIAPLFKWQVEGIDLGMQPLCWLKYIDVNGKEKGVRDILVKQRLFNPLNSRSTFTMDDWFEQRRYSSFIIKTSNFLDISIMDDPEVKRNGIEALIEGERKKQQLLDYQLEQNED